MAMHFACKNTALRRAAGTAARALALAVCLLPVLAPRAAAEDFPDWKAAARRGIADAKRRRAAGQEFCLIYGGNPKGRVLPYPPSSDALGGLSRRAAVIKSLRRSCPANLSVDAGNMLNAASSELRARLAAGYYDLMDFDAIAPGEGELSFGLDKFYESQRYALPIVASNADIPEGVGIYGGILLSRGGFQMYLLNIIGGSVWANNGVEYDFNADMNRMRDILAGRDAANAKLRAAVVHGDMKDIESVASALPALGVIIAGSLEEKFDSPRKIGGAVVLSAGTENRFVGCASLRFDGKNGLAYTGNKLYPVYQDTAPDSLVENIVRLVNLEVSFGGRDEYAAAPISGVIPFLSDRDGKTSGAFLKTIDISREYALGAGMDYCRKPVISTIGNRAAFVYGKPEEMNGKLRMVDLATMNGRTVSQGGNVLEAAFSGPDDFLYYIEADSGKEAGAIYRTRTFMYGAARVLEQDGGARRDLSVSGDGATILFCSNSGGFWHIYAVDSSAAAPPARLTAEKANHRRPRMSPDGKLIAYLSDLGGFDGRMELWVLELKSRKRRQITVSANVRDFCWRDDSRTVYFSSGVNVAGINGVDVLEKQAAFRKITPGGSEKTWSETAPMFIRYKGAPKIVYTREYIGGKRELHWFDTRDMTDRKIFAFGEWNEWTE